MSDNKRKTQQLQDELSKQPGVHTFYLEPHRELEMKYDGEEQPRTITGPATITINVD